jgi:alanyl-tRNA synthetase
MNETRRLFFEDAYRTEFEARVVGRSVVDGRPAVVLDATAFYPESGGQPWDLGTIHGVPVLKVVEEGTIIVHILEREISEENVRGCVDWNRRFDHMQQHSGQHILSQAFVEVARGETRSFHLGEAMSTLEIGLPSITDETLDRVEQRANAVVFRNLAVKTAFVPPDRISEVPLRRPPKVEGTIRVVEVDGFDLSACGGTHVRRAGEIGLIKIVGWEKIRGNLRFVFVCGGRALEDYQVKVRVARDLVGRFSVQDGEVPAAVEKLALELKGAKKRLRIVEEKAAGYEAKELAAAAEGRIVTGIFTGRSPEAVRALALALVRQGEFAAVFAVRSESRSHIVLARSESLDVDLRRLVGIIAPLLNGKGGGGPSLVEIAGDLGADLAVVVETAKSELAAASVTRTAGR